MEARMASLKRKNFLVDEQALKKAKRILGAKTESDAVRQAISLVAFRKAVMRGYDRAAGKLDVLAGLLQEKYGYTHQRAVDEIDKRVTEYEAGLKAKTAPLRSK